MLKKENTESDENDVLMMVSQYASALQDILEWYNKEAVGTDIIYFNSETETHEYPHDEKRLGTGFNVIYNDDKKKYVINKILDTGINRLKLLEKVGGLEVVNEISDELFSIFPYMKEYCFSRLSVAPFII